MGLDLTIYMAKRGARDTFNPFMPDPPRDHHWAQVADWRNFGSLTEALFPGAGSPDWKHLTPEDIDRTLSAMVQPGWGWPATPRLSDALKDGREERFQHMLRNTLTIIRGYMQEGRIFLVEVLR